MSNPLLSVSDLEESQMYEAKLKSETLFHGRIITLEKDTVQLPSGHTSTREVVRHSAAAAVLAENDLGQLLLIRQFRYPIGKVVWEIPAGIAEQGEDLEDTAIRELQEETGWKPLHIEEVCTFVPTPGFCDERIHLFYARQLVVSQLPQDEDECIQTFFLSVEAVETLLASRQIEDGKTLVALYWFLSQRRKEQ